MKPKLPILPTFGKRLIALNYALHKEGLNERGNGWHRGVGNGGDFGNLRDALGDRWYRGEVTILRKPNQRGYQ